MSNTTDQQLNTAADVHASLRRWARGAYADEAAVELIIRTFHGRFALPTWPWIAALRRTGEYWLDADAIQSATDQLSGGEQRVLALVAALSGSQRLDRGLAEVMSGVDRDNQTLILAALSHAGGSHQQNGYQRRADGSYRMLDAKALFPWPEAAARGQDSLPLSSPNGERRSVPAGRLSSSPAVPGR